MRADTCVHAPVHARMSPRQPANSICKHWQIYTVQKGAVGNIFLFTGFHFTPVNHKIITTAFLCLLPICNICLSVSYLYTHTCNGGGNNLRPEGTISPLLPEDYSLPLPETAIPALSLLTEQQAWRKTPHPHNQESGFLSIYGEQEIRNI